MRVRILSVFLLISTSSLLFSSVICDPNHHHNHNDFPWQNILSSLGIGIEKQTEPSGDVTVGGKDHYTSESSVDIVKSETRDESEIPVVAQSEHYASESTMGILKSETKEESEMPNVTQNVPRFKITLPKSTNDDGLSLGYKVSIPIVAILFVVGLIYCACKCCYICVEACCCGCGDEETPQQVVVMQSNVETQPPAPQIILQQPIIHQQPPPAYDPQWKWPSQGPPQWAPHPTGQPQHYSPNSGYDNAGFVPSTAPSAYNTGRY